MEPTRIEGNVLHWVRAGARALRRKLRRSVDAVRHRLRLRKGVLVYVGVNRGGGFDALIGSYKRCFGFEADPELCAFLRDKYKGNRRIEIIHAAASSHNGTVTLNIADNDGASSSLGVFKPEWGRDDVKMVRRVEVPAVRLADFFASRDIRFVDTYVSDIQGMDLEVLKSLGAFLQNRQIGTLICETTKDAFGNIYSGLPDNSETGFRNLLQDNYVVSARGWGVLTKGKFEEVPADWWEMDVMWTRKRR